MAQSVCREAGGVVCAADRFPRRAGRAALRAQDAAVTGFKGLPNVRAAYLARVADGPSTGLRLCVRTELGYDRCVLRSADAAFASLPIERKTLEVLFVDEEQERELRRVCVPFYARKT